MLALLLIHTVKPVRRTVMHSRDVDWRAQLAIDRKQFLVARQADDQFVKLKILLQVAPHVFVLRRRLHLSDQRIQPFDVRRRDVLHGR